MTKPNNKPTTESGNILFIILLSIALIGALTAAIQSSSQQRNNIDDETLILRANQIQGHSTEFETGIRYIFNNGHSESDIRFAHPDADSDYGDLTSDTDTSNQLFANDGGGATYRSVPSDINDGSAWEFFGNTALKDVGSDSAELIAVLPNVTQNFCETINKLADYEGQPTDSGTCIYGGDGERFNDSTQFSSSPNTTDESSFAASPTLKGCVECTSDDSYHYFHVLISR